MHRSNSSPTTLQLNRRSSLPDAIPLNPRRRDVVGLFGAAAVAGALPSIARAGAGGIPARVVVIGGGFAGATVAKYLRLWGGGIRVTLVERNTDFVSCPMSNRVLVGRASIAGLTFGYGELVRKHGVRVVNDTATDIDPERRSVTLTSGKTLGYEHLVVAPGIELDYSSIPALVDEAARGDILHAWKAGEQTVALRRQLESIPDGGVFAITIPKAPYRCPPGPYERACLVAWYLRENKPKSKVLILDANDKVASKEALFRKAWADLYPGIVEYLPNSELVDVDVATRTAKLQFDDVKADVLNVIPPMKAGVLAARAGLITANNKWCGVDFLTYESVARKHIHVLGDAILAGPLMAKSAHMANQQAKVCAAAIIAMVHGEAVNPAPVINNTCYSYVDATDAIHIASVHAYDADQKQMMPVPGSGGLSDAPSELEGRYAEGWAQNMWADSFG